MLLDVWNRTYTTSWHGIITQGKAKKGKSFRLDYVEYRLTGTHQASGFWYTQQPEVSVSQHVK